MIVALVLWRIRAEARPNFLQMWREVFRVEDRGGLIGEFLSEPIDTDDPRLRTLDLAGIGSKTANKLILVNVGFWETVEAFDEQVGRFMKSADADKSDFEYEVRLRALLSPIAWRRGDALLPAEDSLGVR